MLNEAAPDYNGGLLSVLEHVKGPGGFWITFPIAIEALRLRLSGLGRHLLAVYLGAGVLVPKRYRAQRVRSCFAFCEWCTIGG